jgi:DNA-binding beta-propeller fold protein YncE
MPMTTTAVMPRCRILMPVTLIVLVLTACGSTASAPGDPGSQSSRRAGPDYAYISNGSGLVPFNLANHSIGQPIDLGMPAPFEHLTVTPGGRSAYLISRNGIVRLNLGTGTVGPPISTVRNCQSISIGGRGQNLYVAGCGDSAAGFKSILTVNVKTGAAGAPIAVPGTPSGVFVSPDGRTAYAQTDGGATLTPVDLATRALGNVITVPEGVSELAFSPGGGMAYANGTTNAVIGKQTYSYLTPINLTTGVAEKPIALLHAPNGIALSSNGQTAYVTGGTYPAGLTGPPTPPDVTSIDLASGRVRGTFSIPGGANGITNASS